MADEQVAPEGGDAPAAPDAPQYTEIEQQALEHGWKPESEFDASSGKEFRSAKEFMTLKPLYDKIDEQHKEVKNLKRGMEAFGKHYNKMEQAAYERAMTDLKAKRREALSEGDLVLADEISEEMNSKKAEATRLPAVTEEAPVDRSVEMTSWRTKNDWYEKDEDMTAYADGVGNKLLRSGKDPSDILVEVAKRTRAAFPHKFRNPNKESAPKVEGGSSKSKGGSDVSFMSSSEIQIMETLIRSGAPITREGYISDLKKSKGVK